MAAATLISLALLVLEEEDEEEDGEPYWANTPRPVADPHELLKPGEKDRLFLTGGGSWKSSANKQQMYIILVCLSCVVHRFSGILRCRVLKGELYTNRIQK